MVAIDFRSWKITLNPVEHHSEPDGAALSLLRSNEATWRFALDMRVQANDLECRIPAVERARSEGRGGRVPPPKELFRSGGSTPIGVACYVAVHFVASEIEA